MAVKICRTTNVVRNFMVMMIMMAMRKPQKLFWKTLTHTEKSFWLYWPDEAAWIRRTISVACHTHSIQMKFLWAFCNQQCSASTLQMWRRLNCLLFIYRLVSGWSNQLNSMFVEFSQPLNEWYRPNDPIWHSAPNVYLN